MSFLQDLLGDAYKEGMTVEEIDAALSAAGVGKIDTDLQGKYNALKSSFDKTASEAADYKKKYREKLSDDEKKKAEQEEALRTLREENDTLKKAQTVAEYTAHFIGLGFSQEKAAETAKAMAEGDMDAVFRNTAEVNTAREKAIRAEAMKQTPVPPAGDGNEVMTKEKFDKLDWSKQMDWIKEHPNWKSELK